LIDLRDLMANTRDGLHIASLAGTWIALVCGFGGMRDQSLPLSFAPRLPAELTRLVFRICFQGRRLRVEVTRTHASYMLTAGAALEIRHYGKAAKVERRRRLTLPIPRAPRRDAPTQPRGRAPERRRRTRTSIVGVGATPLEKLLDALDALDLDGAMALLAPDCALLMCDGGRAQGTDEGSRTAERPARAFAFHVAPDLQPVAGR
jgi:hypothetical protein